MQDKAEWKQSKEEWKKHEEELNLNLLQHHATISELRGNFEIMEQTWVFRKFHEWITFSRYLRKLSSVEERLKELELDAVRSKEREEDNDRDWKKRLEVATKATQDAEALLNSEMKKFREKG